MLALPWYLLIVALLEAPLADLRDVPAPSLPGAGQMNLAAGPDGRVYLSWIDPLPDSVHALRFAVLGANGWSQPRTVAQGRDWFINWADFPSLQVDSTITAHWLQKSSAGRYSYGVRLSQSRDGGVTWSAPITPHRDNTPTEHGFVSLWPGSAAWVDGRSGGAMGLWTATHGGPDVELDSRICDCCQTGAAITSDGPVIVYRDRSEDEIRDIAIVRQVNGTWTRPAIVAADGWRINACPVNGPIVAAAGRRVAVAWFTGANGGRRVNVAFSSDAGATFGAPVQVDDGRPVGRTGIVMLDGGDAIVSWLEDTDAGAEVRVRRMGANRSRGEAQTVARTTSARPSGFPRMVRAGNRVVFAWREPEGGGTPARVRTAVARIP